MRSDGSDRRGVDDVQSQHFPVDRSMVVVLGPVSTFHRLVGRRRFLAEKRETRCAKAVPSGFRSHAAGRDAVLLKLLELVGGINK